MTGAKLIVESNVRAAVNEKKYRISQDFLNGLEEYTLDLLKVAIKRARKNRRKVLISQDIGV